ncbi:MAG TPA: long-chain fatty acid--CoA ligase [Acidimicrobiia bacterium]|nr:long-chain fatty acid--CoA ligase [Acidimicrobiia bacterium]
MNTATLLLQAATRHPDQIAARFGERAVDYATFADRAARLGNGLRSLGLETGDRVAIVQRNGIELLETVYGALLAGLAVVPINMRLHPREIAFIANDSGCRAIVHTGEFNAGLDSVAADMGDVRARISTAPSHGEQDYEALLDGGKPLDRAIDVHPEAVAWLFYTSGTTGRPKGVMWTHRTVHNLVLSYLADIYSMQPSDVVLHAAPLSHGSGTVALSAIARAAQNVILHTPSFDTATLFGLVERHGVTNIAFLAPTQIVKMLDEYEPGRYDLTSLRCIVYGGAPMYTDHLRRALETFGPIFVQVFGQGESPLTISYLSALEHVRWWQEGHERLTSAGIPRTGIEIRIGDDDDNTLALGETGEILCRGEIVMPGYWRNPQATADTLRGGWLHTGDVGKLDERGYLYVLDRSKDMVVSGGNNIYPREVEDVLQTHPAVAECAVIGIPDEYWGEAVHAIVCLNDGEQASAEELLAYCVAHLASYKKPRSFEFRDALPKNAYGKIMKRELREEYWGGHDRRVGGGPATEIIVEDESAAAMAAERTDRG